VGDKGNRDHDELEGDIEQRLQRLQPSRVAGRGYS
jgi:hypothetical protein